MIDNLRWIAYIVSYADYSPYGPLPVFFYANDREEPPHIHGERGNRIAKFWIYPVRLQQSGGFSRSEINKLQKLVEENQEFLRRGWNEYFVD
ncbi:MAG: DUF4160 domain-containing protein [Pseudomonadota bacterium]